MEKKTTTQRMKTSYGLNDMPPLSKAIPFGLQHVLSMFAGNLAVALIICSAIGLSLGDTAFIVQCTLFTAGITTMVQAFGLGPVGAKLPIMMGSTFTFLSISISIGANPALGLSALFGAFLIGGIIEAFLGQYIIRHLKKYLTPIVTGSVVLAIGLSLLGIGLNYAAGGDSYAADYGSLANLGVAAFTFLVAVGFSAFGKGFLKNAAVFIAMVAGFLLAWIAGMIDFSSIGAASWVSIPIPLKFGISFKLEAILPIAFLYIVSMLEFIGDTTGVTYNCEARTPTPREMTGGILCDGLGSSFAALFNAMPNVSFSQNVGLIAITGVKSRFIVGIGGIILLITSFFPKATQIFTLIPKPVLGGACIVMFGMIVISGMKVIASQRLTARNSLILACSIGVGMGIYFQPDAVVKLPFIVTTLLSGVAGTALVALLLNIILPSKSTDHVVIERNDDDDDVEHAFEGLVPAEDEN